MSKEDNCVICGTELTASQKKCCGNSCAGVLGNQNCFGENAKNWRGGRNITPDGYVRIYQPLHPDSNKSGYAYEHRIVMEFHLGRVLKSSEIVHHINCDKSDNRIENLQLCQSASEHCKLHNDLSRNKLGRSDNETLH